MSKVISGAAAPRSMEADIVLKDGSTVHVRTVRPGDEAAILEFLDRLSPESRYFRFFSGAPNLMPAARRPLGAR